MASRSPAPNRRASGLLGLPDDALLKIASSIPCFLDRLSLGAASTRLQALLRTSLEWTVDLHRAPGDAARLAAMAAWARGRAVTELRLRPPLPARPWRTQWRQALFGPGFELALLNGLSLRTLDLYSLATDRVEGFRCCRSVRAVSLNSQRASFLPGEAPWDVTPALTSLPKLEGLWLRREPLQLDCAQLASAGSLGRLTALQCALSSLQGLRPTALSSLRCLTATGSVAEAARVPFMPSQLVSLRIGECSALTERFLPRLPHLTSLGWYQETLEGPQGQAALSDAGSLPQLRAFYCSVHLYGGEALSLPSALVALSFSAGFDEASFGRTVGQERGRRSHWLARAAQLTRLSMLLEHRHPSGTVLMGTGAWACAALHVLGEALPPRLQQLDLTWAAALPCDARLVSLLRECRALQQVRVTAKELGGSCPAADVAAAAAAAQPCAWAELREQLEARGVQVALEGFGARA